MIKLLTLLFTLTLGFSQEFIPYFTPTSTTTGNYLTISAEAFWGFEETTGNITDSSGNGRDLIEVGVVPTTISGVVTNARSFEDTLHTNYFTLTNVTEFSFPGDFTIAGWAQFDTDAPNIDDKTIIARGNYAGGTNFSWTLELDSGTFFDYIAFYWSYDGSFDPANRLEFNLGGDVSEASYYFIVLRRVGSTLHLSATYLFDDELATDVTASVPGQFFDDSTTELRVGVFEGSEAHDMRGYIDELGIWSRYLNDCELGYLFSAKLGMFSWAQFNAYPCALP